MPAVSMTAPRWFSLCDDLSKLPGTRADLLWPLPLRKSVRGYNSIRGAMRDANKGYRNSFSFTGWYGRETDDENSWRWTARKGEVHILSPQPAETTLNGELTSVRSPNTVDILVNGVTLASVATYSPAPWPIGSLHLQLKAGDNVLEFASRNKGVQLPTDSRVLAIAIRNLRTETTDGGGCPVE
jgi:hypothetical protein